VNFNAYVSGLNIAAESCQNRWIKKENKKGWSTPQ